MAPTGFDLNRLYVQLNNTGLQNKDPALYQVIFLLIGSLKQLINQVGGISGGSTVNITNLITDFIGIPGEGNDGESGYPIPGPAGINGVTGAQGPQGVTLLSEDGVDGNDGFNIPNPGPQGATGAQGPMGVSLFPLDGEDGQDGFSIQGPAGTSSDWTTIFKAGDTSRSANTVLDDPDLIVPVLANSTYTIELIVFFTGDTASDFRYVMAGPAGLSHVTNASFVINPNTTTGTFAILESLPGSGSPVAVACLTGQDGILHIFITVAIGATPGNVSFMWGQNTTVGGEHAIVYAGSWVRYKKVA